MQMGWENTINFNKVFKNVFFKNDGFQKTFSQKRAFSVLKTFKINKIHGDFILFQLFKSKFMKIFILPRLGNFPK